MKTYWITAGVGTLVAAVGGAIYVTSNYQNGVVIILGGMVVAVMGLVMALVQGAMNKSK